MKRTSRELGQDRPEAAFGGVTSSADASGPRQRAAREFFTVDLRGLRAALVARAAAAGMTESDVLRSALAKALGDLACCAADSVQAAIKTTPPATLVKLSVRLARLAAARIDQQAHAAGLSRGAYLTRLIDGAPPVAASPDRAAGAAALRASAAELAVLSRDINHLTKLLSHGNVEAARPYRERLDTLDGDVRKHLEKAAAVLAVLSPTLGTKRRPHPLAGHDRSTP